MNTLSQRGLCALLTVLFAAGTLQAQGDFFWTAAPFGSGLIKNQDLDLFVPVGSSKSIYLYWTTSGPAKSQLRLGAILDVGTSSSGIIAFDAGETMDFDIVLADDPSIVVDERWRSSFLDGGHSGAPFFTGPDLLMAFSAFRVTGPGIRNENTGPVLLDLGYDARADAFLFGRVDFTALAPGIVEITAGPFCGPMGQRKPCPENLVDIEPVPAAFTRLFVNVIGNPILGDVNNDGATSLDDVPFFVDLLSSNRYQIEADMNQDKRVDLEDVLPLVNLLSDK